MRKFIALLVAALAVPCAARAQDFGAHQFGSLILNTPLPVTSGGTGSGNPGLIGGTNVTVTGAWPNQTISAIGGGGTPGGTSGQIQYNNAGAFGGFTVSGDGTLDTSTGALTITKAGGVAFGSAAFQASSAFDAAGAAAAAQAASLPIGATTLPASFVASSLTSAAGGAFGTGAYAPAYVLPTATSGVLGGVKPDGTTLTNSSGAISVTYGTVAATAAQGNDSRITGALQSSALGSGVATALGVAKNTTGGVVLLNGSPTSGNLAQWSSSGWQDSGISASAAAANCVLAGPNGSSGALSCRLIVAADLGSYALAPAFLSVALKGTSSGNDTLASLNASTSSRTISIPSGTANDTLALLAANQTFSGANTFSGAVGHSGSAAFSGAPATLTANQTAIIGGTTAPSYPAATSGLIYIGGQYTLGTLSTNGTGGISTSAAGGLIFQGKGATYNYTFYNGTVSGAALDANGSWYARGYYNLVSTHLWDSGTAPTTLGNGTLTYSNGSGAFVIAATGGTQTITFVLPAATARWVCKATDETTLTTDVVATPTAGIVTTGVTLTAVTRSTGALTNFTASDVVSGLCRAL